MSMSRRKFIGIGGLTAVAAMSAGALAGCSPETAPTEEEVAAATEGTGPSFMTAPDKIADEDIVETKDYEIVVVGAGNSGLAAVASALKNGAKVACVEKSTQANSSGMAAGGIDLDRSDPAAVQYIIDKHLASNGFRSIREVVETWALRSGEAINYMKEFTAGCDDPIDYAPETGKIPGEVVFEYPGTDLKATVIVMMPSSGNYAKADPVIADYAATQGAEFFYSMPAVQLATDDSGAVTGVICQDEDGAYHKYNASKGVILCAGDYQNDTEMLEYYLPDMRYASPMQEGKTGDGHKMAMWVGGVMEPVGHTKMSHNYGNGPMGDQPFLRVTLKGERFCSEIAPLFQTQTFFRLKNEPVEYFQVFDSNFVDQVTSWGGTPEPEDAFAGFIERGTMVTANSLEELASAMEIEDADVFLQTIDRYNELAAKGYDEDFGKESKFMKSIDAAPFYAIRRRLPITAIVSGLITDGDQHVLNAEGEPIKGLYAAGNTAGGFFGAIDYPLRVMESDPIGRSTIEGVSVGRAMTGGYVAAENAANGI